MANLILKNATAIWEAISTEAEGWFWEGSLDNLRVRVELSQGQFNKAWKFLKESECILLVRPGNRYDQTRVALDSAPTEKIFEDWRLTEPSKTDMVEQRLRDISRLLGGVNVKNLEARVTQLEEKLKTYEGEFTSGNSHWTGKDQRTAPEA